MSTQVAWLDGVAHNTFTFTFSVAPHTTFQFPPHPTSSKSRPPKRRRPLWDVDGSTTLGKKKRRLRLNLITSRLSKPFSSPASNVADHGVKKVTVYRGGKGNMMVEKGDLRKTALINCVRRRVEDMKVGSARARALVLPPPPPLPTAQAMPTHSQLMCRMALRDVLAVKPRTTESSPSLPPSPLGQSNYDALDLEDEDDFGARYGSGVDENDSDGSWAFGGSTISTPSSAAEGENYDFLDEMDGIPYDGVDGSYEVPERRWWV